MAENTAPPALSFDEWIAAGGPSANPATHVLLPRAELWVPLCGQPGCDRLVEQKGIYGGYHCRAHGTVGHRKYLLKGYAEPPAGESLPPEAIAARDKALADIYSQSVEETMRQRDKAQEEVHRLNPYADTFGNGKPPEDPLGRFLFGVRYYAGMLEDGDNWGHSLGHIQECCKEFEAAVVDRARRGGISGGSVPPHTCSNRHWCLACADIFKRWFARSLCEGTV